MSHRQIFAGQLRLDSNGEEDDILYLNAEPLAEQVMDITEEYGQYLSVRYWITAQELGEEQLQTELALIVLGLGHAEYAMRYSEETGYLWTDEELQVGGHDLLGELKGEVGHWLFLDIQFDQSPLASE